MFSKKIKAPSYFRCFNALPSSTHYDFYIDGEIYVKDVIYQDFNDFIGLETGSHELTVTLNQQEEPILKKAFWCSNQRIYTFVLAPDIKTTAPSLYFINEPTCPIPEGQCLIRMAPFAMCDSPCKVFLQEDLPAFKKVVSRKVTHYLAFMPAQYNVQLILPQVDEGSCLLEHWTFKPSRLYTVYLIGGLPDFPLQMIVSIDGSSYLDVERPN